MSVFHLKYRPTKISELDLVEVAETLRIFLKAKDIPQSFLFSGPKGSGKTSAARILARAINCEERKDGEPCNSCENCKDILSGRSIDIMEMDAASNRGIEDVRNLKDKAYLSPSKLKYKVFIIDEVHMMTKEAFNALLKLIEEPPAHTIFILCTTDASKIPDTVMSRLIKVDFRKGDKKALKNSLEKIIEGEKIEIDEKTVEFLLDKSDGSFRNLQKNFNEIVLSLGKKIYIDDVILFFSNKSGDYDEIEFEKDLLTGETKKILEKLEKMATEGVDFVGFRQKLVEYFMKKLLLIFDVGVGEKSKFGVIQLESWITLLIRVAKQEKETEIDQLPLELAVIDFINTNKDFLINNKDEASSTHKIVETKKNEVEKVDSDNPLVLEVTGLDLEKIVQSWGNILLAIKPFNHSVEAFLRASRPIKYVDRKLTLEVFYPFHKDRLEEPKNKKIVEEGLFRVLGVELMFDCVLGKSRKAPLIIQNDTPVENVSDQLVEKKENKEDLYDVAKDIFG
jgi:DNA polymerase-3 subunit gamma/tau